MDDNNDLADLTADERALLASVDALLSDDATWSDPPAHLESAVLDAIRGEHARFAPTALPSRRRWQSVGLGVLAGAAAASLVAVVVTRDNASTQPTAGPAADVVMAGTDLAPAASGSVTVTPFTSGVRIAVRVPGLPRREGGEFYQMWVKNCGGNHLVPAGTFHDLSDAVGWVGVSLTDYPIITVTREVTAGPTDALQGSSGEVVVKGQLGTCPT